MRDLGGGISERRGADGIERHIATLLPPARIVVALAYLPEPPGDLRIAVLQTTSSAPRSSRSPRRIPRSITASTRLRRRSPPAAWSTSSSAVRSPGGRRDRGPPSNRGRPAGVRRADVCRTAPAGATPSTIPPGTIASATDAGPHRSFRSVVRRRRRLAERWGAIENMNRDHADSCRDIAAAALRSSGVDRARDDRSRPLRGRLPRRQRCRRGGPARPVSLPVGAHSPTFAASSSPSPAPPGPRQSGHPRSRYRERG